MQAPVFHTAGILPFLTILGACVLGAGLAGGGFPWPSSTLSAVIWLLGAAGGACLLLRRGIDLDDRARELASRLCLEQKARRSIECTLADTQSVLSRVVRQQESVRDGERQRIARDIDGELGQVLVALRADMSLLLAASAGIHPATHQRTGAMIMTLDLALRALRGLAGELRPLAAGEGLSAGLARQLAEFSRTNGIAHQLEITPGADYPGAGEAAEREADALLYRALQEVLAQIARAARATEVKVQLGRNNARLILSIDENGGFDGAGGCALAALRERVRASGGALQADALASGGTRIALTVSRVHAVVPG